MISHPVLASHSNGLSFSSCFLNPLKENFGVLFISSLLFVPLFHSILQASPVDLSFCDFFRFLFTFLSHGPYHWSVFPSLVFLYFSNILESDARLMFLKKFVFKCYVQIGYISFRSWRQVQKYHSVQLLLSRSMKKWMWLTIKVTNQLWDIIYVFCCWNWYPWILSRNHQFKFKLVGVSLVI